MSRKPEWCERHPTSYVEARDSGRFRAWCPYVVDGDTVDAIVDLGARHYPYLAIRIDEIDTPEIYGVRHDSEEYQLGLEASAFTKSVALDRPILVQLTDEESINRWVGHVWVLGEDDTWQNLASLLRGHGFTE